MGETRKGLTQDLIESGPALRPDRDSRPRHLPTFSLIVIYICLASLGLSEITTFGEGLLHTKTFLNY